MCPQLPTKGSRTMMTSTKQRTHQGQRLSTQVGEINTPTKATRRRVKVARGKCPEIKPVSRHPQGPTIRDTYQRGRRGITQLQAGFAAPASKSDSRRRSAQDTPTGKEARPTKYQSSLPLGLESRSAEAYESAMTFEVTVTKVNLLLERALFPTVRKLSPESEN